MLSDTVGYDSFGCRISLDPIVGIRRYPTVGKRRKLMDIAGFRLSEPRRIRLSENVRLFWIRWDPGGEFRPGILSIKLLIQTN
jgi:hypothetical protein